MNQSVVAEVSTQGLSRNKWLEIWWGFFWRGICILLISIIVGAFIGIVLGLILGFSGAIFRIPKSTIIIVLKAGIFISSFVTGILIFAYWLRWIFKARFGEYRLALVKDIVLNNIADTNVPNSSGINNDIFNIPVKL